MREANEDVLAGHKDWHAPIMSQFAAEDAETGGVAAADGGPPPSNS